MSFTCLGAEEMVPVPVMVTGVCVCSECGLDVGGSFKLTIEEDRTSGVEMRREVASEVDGITLFCGV